MQTKATTIEEYIENIPQDRLESFTKLRTIILDNIPEGFNEEMSYGMIGYVVPFDIYPSGYHCTPKLPLPFLNLANQKNYISLYHMGIYADKKLLSWFEKEYKKACKYKLDMGKGCIRFKRIDDIPYELIGKLVQKMTVQNWIDLYEKTFRNKK